MDRRQLLKIMGLGFLLPVPKLHAWPRPQNVAQVAQWYKFDAPLTEATFVALLHNHHRAGCLSPNVAEMNAIAVEDLVASIYPTRTYIANSTPRYTSSYHPEPMYFYYPGGRVEIKAFLNEDEFYNRSKRHVCLRYEDA